MGKIPAFIAARPSEALARTSGAAQMIRTKIRDSLGQEDYLAVLKFSHCLGLSDSFVGLGSSLYQFSLDLAALYRLVPGFATWPKKYEDIARRLFQNDVLDPARDRELAISQPASTSRGFVIAPSFKIQPGVVVVIRGIRALVLITHLTDGKTISRAVAQELAGWASGNASSQKLFAHGSLDADALGSARSGLKMDSESYKILTQVIRALRISPPSPFLARDQGGDVPPIVRVIDGIAKEPERVQAVLETETEEEPKNEFDPLVAYKASILTAGPMVMSGVECLYQFVHPKELELIFPTVVEMLLAGSDEALAATLTLLFRVPPGEFAKVPLGNPSGAGLWLDTDRGLILWNYDEIISFGTDSSLLHRNRESRHVAIPFPLEVANEISKRLKEVDSASSLADLFSKDPEELKRSTKSFLRGIAVTSHRPTATRLSGSWARFVLALSRDEIYSAAIGLDFRLGTTAGFSYVMLRGERIRQLTQDAYSRIGFSGQLRATELEDVGTRFLPTDETVEAYLRDGFTKLANAIKTFPKNAPVERIRDTHHKVVLPAIYPVFVFLTGKRPTKEESVTRTAIDFDQGVIRVTDKRSTPYHGTRVIPIVPTLKKWLLLYVDWLQMIAYRLSKVDRDLASKISHLTQGVVLVDFIPFFFKFGAGGKIYSAGSKDLKKYLGAWGMQPNAGRHWLDSVLRNANVDSAAIMAMMGRGGNGQECFGSRSAAVPIEVMVECANAIEHKLCEFDLPDPPTLQSRRWSSQKATGIPYVPKLNAGKPSFELVGAPRRGIHEISPFGNQTVKYSAIFKLLLGVWRKRGPQNVGSIGMSLIFEDGVINRHEFDSSIQAVAREKIFKSKDRYFFDVLNPHLGVRRVWISRPTFRLATKMQPGMHSDSLISDCETAARGLLESIGVTPKRDPLDEVLACAAAFHSLRVPGDLFAWMVGRISARTTRPETLARHLSGFCEHPGPDFGKRRRSQLTESERDIDKVIKAAKEEVESGSAHKTALAGLANKLQELMRNLDDQEVEYLLAGFAFHLCQQLCNIHSLVRYMLEARLFLRQLSDQWYENRLATVDWHLEVNRFLAERGVEPDSEKTPAKTAVNHFLDWQGVDYQTGRRTDPPPAAFAYAEYPSSMELDRAVALLEEQVSATGDLADRAAICLRILGCHAIRWDELVHLRSCDVHLGKSPHIVLNYEAGGDLKSKNSPRVLFINDEELTSQLSKLRKLRLARFPEDTYVTLFGDSNDARSLGECYEIHGLITAALGQVTGSSLIGVHDIRHTVLTNAANKIDCPASNRQGLALELRTEFYRTSAQAGQGDPHVLFVNYQQEKDRLRRQWVDKVLVDTAPLMSRAFLSGVTGIPEGTYRVRESRGAELSQFSLIEGYEKSVTDEFAERLLSLDEFVMKDKTRISELKSLQRKKLVETDAAFIGLKMCGENDAAAALLAGMSKKDAQRVNNSLNLLGEINGHLFLPRSELKGWQILKDIETTHLPTAIEVCVKNPAIAAKLSSGIKESGSPLIYSSQTDPLLCSSMMSALREYGLIPWVRFRAFKSSSQSNKLMQEYFDLGFVDVKSTTSKSFPSEAGALMGFGKRLEGEVCAKTTSRWTYLVSACVLAVAAGLMGSQD